jgi:tRNA uracil 4-sulfurtransferase
MEKLILVRYAEIHLKGLNRPYFEKLLVTRIRESLKGFDGVKVLKMMGRVFVKGIKADGLNEAVSIVKKVFGVHSLSIAVQTEKSIEALSKEATDQVKEYMQKNGLENLTFKVEAKRADKRFPMTSMQAAAQIGGNVLEEVKGLLVDIKTPQIKVFVEIREDAFCYTEIIPAVGGMPVGSSGKAMLLLSGGIDSPVAAYMLAKRGVKIEAIHFFSPPYTSEKAKQKVITLCEKLCPYLGGIRLNIINFTEIQKEQYQKCPEKETTILMRRTMMKIAERVAKKNKCQALITGESLGQVASQTIESLVVTNSSVKMPVFRPLVGLDKSEIIKISQDIDTFETSILPFEDCCTVFVPKHPVTKPKLEDIEKSEELYDEKKLIDKAIENMETVDIKI